MTIRLEFIGSQVRCSPGRPAVNPSVARRTYVARTVPWAVTARASPPSLVAGSIRSTGVDS